jgi:hypothetical protein
VVGRSHVVHCDDLLGLDLAEHGDLVCRRLLERDVTSACKSGLSPALLASLIAA